MSTVKTVGVGVIGAGMMGADHVRTLSTAVDGAHVAAVADADPARAAAAAALGGGRAFADPHALIADPEVDAVIVASFDPTHEEFVLACIAAGKRVLCEKPLATTAEACLHVVEAEVGGRPAAGHGRVHAPPRPRSTRSCGPASARSAPRCSSIARTATPRRRPPSRPRC